MEYTVDHDYRPHGRIYKPCNARIAGRFIKVSGTDYRDGIVLVAFCGDIWAHDLNSEEIAYIKAFYNMPQSEHVIMNDWPDEISPAYPAAKNNYKNGYMLLKERSK